MDCDIKATNVVTDRVAVIRRFYPLKSGYKIGRNPPNSSSCRFMIPSRIDTKSGSTLQQLVLVTVSFCCLDGFDSTHGSPELPVHDGPRHCIEERIPLFLLGASCAHSV